MSFTKTISVFAALASIFAAGAAGWKLAQGNESETPVYEQKIEELQKEISDLKEKATPLESPAPITLPPAPQPITVPQHTPPVPPPPVPSQL